MKNEMRQDLMITREDFLLHLRTDADGRGKNERDCRAGALRSFLNRLFR